MTGNPLGVSLEPAAQEFVDATSQPPFLYQLPPEEGRKAVDSVQDSPIEKPAIDEEWITVEGGPTGSVRARIVKPQGVTDILPVIVYTHGAGWVFGDAHTHDRLVRDLAVGVHAAVVFPNTTAPRGALPGGQRAVLPRRAVGAPRTAPRRGSTPPASRSPVIRWAAIWPSR